MKNALHFGGGSIGLGFITDLLFESNYKVTIADINSELVNQINKTNSFDLYLINEDYKKKTITNLKGLSSINQKAEILKEIETTDLITTAVWTENLKKIAPTLLEGLRKRYENKGNMVNVLACENAMFNSDILRKEILLLDKDAKNWLDKIAKFANTAVDRMVFESEHNGQKTIDVGNDYELVIDQSKLVAFNELPIKNAVYTISLEKYIKRKLYVINCGHAWAGYMGALEGYSIIQDVFNDDNLEKEVYKTMSESGHLLVEEYGFSKDEMKEYIEFSINRFKTPGITDSIARVSRSPIRKLQPEERLVGPCIQCENLGIDNSNLLKGIAAVFMYDNPADSQSVELLKFVEKEGIEIAVTHFTSIQEGTRMHKEIIKNFQNFQTNK